MGKYVRVIELIDEFEFGACNEADARLFSDITVDSAINKCVEEKDYTVKLFRMENNELVEIR